MQICRRCPPSLLLLLWFAAPAAANEPFLGWDVVIALDHSSVALVSSGIDVDGDGVVGRDQSRVTEWDPFVKSARFWTTDPGDTVEALQLRVARALVPRLAARQNRVGLVSFTFRARNSQGGTSVVRLTEKPSVSVPVGEPGAVLAALRDFPEARQRRWTDLARLLERAAELLDEASAREESARPRAILLLSLGLPSAPAGLHWSQGKAVEQARASGERGISLWVVPLVRDPTGFLEELTSTSSGGVLPLDTLDAQFAVPDRDSLVHYELDPAEPVP